MWIVYLDESKDSNKTYIYTALVLKAERWAQAFKDVKAFRQTLRRDYGIFLSQELHAWKFAAGKGRVSDRVLLKPKRAEIFRKCLEFTAKCRHFAIMSSVNTNELYAFERLMNRLNRTAKAKQQKILLVCDAGQEVIFTRRIRKMRVHNFIPSRFGRWLSGSGNIPLSEFVEDPFFKDSKSSYFIQLVDFCAYALLRMERPIQSRTALGYDKAYEILRPISSQVANPADPRKMGIIR